MTAAIHCSTARDRRRTGSLYVYESNTIAYDGRSSILTIDSVTQIQIKRLVEGQWPIEGRARIGSQTGLAPKYMLFLLLSHFLHMALERDQF